jgi:hypothetical protein
MVMCVMEEATGAAENLKEASLVAAVAVKLRELLPEGSDGEFWAQRLFIVSPHHAQIRAIKRELRRRREWDAEPFVDTVDKMQGQECDVVLVSLRRVGRRVCADGEGVHILTEPAECGDYAGPGEDRGVPVAVALRAAAASAGS